MVNNDRDSIWIQSTNLKKDYLSMLVHNRENRFGGGLAPIYNNTVLDAKVSSKGACRTFEFAKWKVTSKGITTILIGIYHPPYSISNSITNVIFLDDLMEWLSEQTSQDKNIILAGDFNIHVNNLQNNDKASYSQHHGCTRHRTTLYISNTEQWKHIRLSIPKGMQ